MYVGICVCALEGLNFCWTFNIVVSDGTVNECEKS